MTWGQLGRRQQQIGLAVVLGFCLQHPARQGYIGGAIADIAAAGMEAHHRLHLQPVLARLLEQLDVRRKVVLLRTLQNTQQDSPHYQIWESV